METSTKKRRKATVELESVCKNIFEELKALRGSEFIQEEPQTASYLKSIRDFMCLGKVEEKIKGNQYSNSGLENFALDIRRSIGNFLKYNWRPNEQRIRSSLWRMLFHFEKRWGDETGKENNFDTKELSRAVEELYITEGIENFIKPAKCYFTEEDYPHYKSRVPYPMDIGTVISGVIECRYESKIDIREDLQRIVRNCELFWTTKSKYYAEVLSTTSTFSRIFGCDISDRHPNEKNTLAEGKSSNEDPQMNSSMGTSEGTLLSETKFLMCNASTGAVVDESLIEVSVVDWGGEERAVLAVRKTETVLTGMMQIQEQTGVAISQQRLVVGETELLPSMLWEELPALPRFTTVQLTVLIDEENAFSPFESTASVGNNLVIGTKGLEVKGFSGKRGYVEIDDVTVVAQKSRGGEHVCPCIGIAAHDADSNSDLGDGWGSLAWTVIHSKMETLGVVESHLSGVERSKRLAALIIKDGDKLGILVDCSAVPTVRFFKNRLCVHEIEMTETCTVFPALPGPKSYRRRGAGVINIVSNPDFPSGEWEHGLVEKEIDHRRETKERLRHYGAGW